MSLKYELSADDGHGDCLRLVSPGDTKREVHWERGSSLLTTYWSGFTSSPTLFQWTGLAPWELPFSGSLITTFLIFSPLSADDGHGDTTREALWDKLRRRSPRALSRELLSSPGFSHTRHTRRALPMAPTFVRGGPIQDWRFGDSAGVGPPRDDVGSLDGARAWGGRAVWDKVRRSSVEIQALRSTSARSASSACSAESSGEESKGSPRGGRDVRRALPDSPECGTSPPRDGKSPPRDDVGAVASSGGWDKVRRRSRELELVP